MNFSYINNVIWQIEKLESHIYMANLFILFKTAICLLMNEMYLNCLFLLLQCAENHGMFARQTQLILLDEAGNRTEPLSPSSAGSNATTPDDSAARARSRLNRWASLKLRKYTIILKSPDYTFKIHTFKK